MSAQDVPEGVKAALRQLEATCPPHSPSPASVDKTEHSDDRSHTPTMERIRAQLVPENERSNQGNFW